MDRDIPTFNRSVMQRIYSKNHQLHIKRLKDIKSGISSHKSYSKPAYSNLTNSNSIIAPNYNSKLPQYHNPKRQSIQEMNNTKIERQNALLFKKMLKIMKRPDKNNDPTATRYHATGNAAKQRMSMEFSRINQENKTLFHRLQQQKPTIDMKRLQQERLKNLQILKFLGKYPNQQAMLRASQQQFNTFDLKSRKMNSTSNRIYYNNLNRQHHHQSTEQQLGAQQRFRNQMEGYDRQIRELRDQTKRAATKNSRTIEKFTSTSSGNYYNPRRVSNSTSHNNDMSYDVGNNTYHHYKEHYANNQLGLHHHTNNHNHPNTLSPDQPIPPARRKFLSQGGHRQTAYDPRGKQHSSYNQMNTHLSHVNQNNYDQQVIDHVQGNSQPRQLQKYPYHLNHPSNNIVIQDRLQNYYTNNNNKRKTLQNVREKKGISNSNNNTYTYSANTNNGQHNANNFTGIHTYNGYRKNPAHQPQKPNIPKPYLAPKNIQQNNLQRKLNKKNSQSHIHPPQHIQAQPSVKPQLNILQEQFYHESMEEQDEEDFETEPSPQRISNKKDVEISSNGMNLKNLPNADMKNRKNEQNMILLYKTSISLGKLIVKQQVQEIANDIHEYITKGNSQISFQPYSINKCIMSILSQQMRQISIYRLSQCYTITISNHNSRVSNYNIKKKRYQQHSSKNQQQQYDTNINSMQQIDPSLLQSVKQYLQNALSLIEELEIPEQQGSLLLEEIDYNYKHFIQHMVKVEKDAQDDQGSQEVGMSQKLLYRLVIVLDEAQEAKEQSKACELGHNNSNHKQNYEHSQHPIMKQQNNQPSIHQNLASNVPKDAQYTPNIIKTSQQPQSTTKQTRQNPDSDEQQTLSKPQAVSSNIPMNANEQKNHEKSIYVEALDQQVM